MRMKMPSFHPAESSYELFIQAMDVWMDGWMDIIHNNSTSMRQSLLYFSQPDG
jgi:hypothetical protein